MDKEQQMRAPVYEALEKLKKRRVVPFDVPGHKRGRGNPELPKGYDVTIQPTSLEKLFVSLCGLDD